MFGRGLQSDSWFCVGRNLASVAMMIFSHSIYFIKKFYKFCSFNVICEDNVAINCIAL
jgi:hypothetical protein